MKKLIIGLVLAALLLVLAACAGESEPTSESGPSPMPPPSPAMLPGEERAYKDAGLPSAEEERMIVRTGDISLVVDDVIDARDEITWLAVNLDGWVVSSRITGQEQEMRGWISFRVPDEEFEAALAELRDLAVRVNSESTDSRDVTEEYVDLESRLKNAEATERQYLALLDKADEVEDILKIYDSLSRVRNEIEQIKGRMQYLERITSMSLISVSLEAVGTAKPLVRAGWSALEIVKSAVRGIVTFGQVLGSVVIWFLIFSPVWVAILAIIWWWRRRRKRKRQA